LPLARSGLAAPWQGQAWPAELTSTHPGCFGRLKADSQQSGHPPQHQPTSLLIQLAQLSVFNYPGPAFRAQWPLPLKTLPKALLHLSLHSLQGRAGARPPSSSFFPPWWPPSSLGQRPEQLPQPQGLNGAEAGRGQRDRRRKGRGGQGNSELAPESFVSAEDLNVRGLGREEGAP
jgi:hypothetical protein